MTSAAHHRLLDSPIALRADLGETIRLGGVRKLLMLITIGARSARQLILPFVVRHLSCFSLGCPWQGEASRVRGSAGSRMPLSVGFARMTPFRGRVSPPRMIPIGA